MTPRFHRLSLEEFAALLACFPFSRRINAVHLHHTWRPNHAQFRGHDTIVAMWRYHTQEKGWSDIAQHVTIDPEGMIWTGRNWNRPPASASGQNGNASFGPFMIETVGDFDAGRDRFEGCQRDTVLKVIALVQKRFELKASSLRFHCQMSSKTCPGSAIDYDEVVNAAQELLESGIDIAPTAPPDALPFPRSALALADVQTDLMNRGAARADDPAHAEPEEEAGSPFAYTSGLPGPKPEILARERKLSPAELADLRPHVINLRQGVFSHDGAITCSKADVDAIFEEHLPRRLAAQPDGKPLPIVFYAHGGLVSESSALNLAQQHVTWWLANGVYPIYFVWETGLFETVGQLLERTRVRTRAAARDLWDYTTDPLVEIAVRALYGPMIWGGMKRSAERASADAGGARYTAGKLAEFCKSNGGAVELHAVGHSAGSIFHAHFLPVALEACSLPFKTLHLLAPAARVDLFLDRLAPLMGKPNGIGETTLFTMREDFERADRCTPIYRKSLLYLVSRALEDEPKAPILGLEECLRANAELRRRFGLGRHGDDGDVVWSLSASDDGRSASRSTTHGGFDNDPATMNSVARRVLNKGDTERLERAFPEVDGRRALAADDWSDAVDWPEGLEFVSPPVRSRPSLAGATIGVTTSAPAQTRPVVAPAIGRRLAVCVGIDAYASSPLAGCVADARLWARTLTDLGFDAPTVLVNEVATRSGILDALARALASSQAGDVVVFQYSGHGTQVPDVDNDEAAGDSPGLDEALCPFDMDAGAFLIDDDLAEVLAEAPAGVNVTLFIDCCHSGTISRLGVGAPSSGARGDARFRYITPSPEALEAHRRFRLRLGGARHRRRGPETMREVLFSACLSHEVAWESAGQGEFTLRATRELAAGIEGLSNEAFLERVRRAFGAQPRQHPELDCAPQRRSGPLLGAESALTSVTVSDLGTYCGKPVQNRTRSRIPALLREIAGELDG
ncbi:MAG TPA: caspase family protein [Gammaproteobacteria bacterium]